MGDDSSQLCLCKFIRYGGKISRGLTQVYNTLCFKHSVINSYTLCQTVSCHQATQRKVAKFDSVEFLGKSQNSLRYACNTPEISSSSNLKELAGNPMIMDTI